VARVLDLKEESEDFYTKAHGCGREELGERKGDLDCFSFHDLRKDVRTWYFARIDARALGPEVDPVCPFIRSLTAAGFIHISPSLSIVSRKVPVKTWKSAHRRFFCIFIEPSVPNIDIFVKGSPDW